MKSAPFTEDEKERIEALKSFDVLDTEPEEDYDEIVKLASTICQTPISLVSLVDTNRQWFKARVGLDAPQTGRDIAFCSHAIHNDELLIVPNALEDERFFDNPLVAGDPNIRFYAGMPLKTRTGNKIGTLCIIDREPRYLTEHQKFALKTLGKQVMNMLELRIRNKKLRQLNELQNKFLSIISHDVKSPLSSLQSLIEMINNEDISKDDFAEVSDHVSENISYTIELLNNLINWGSSQILGGYSNMKAVNIYELVNDVIIHLQKTADQKGLQLVNEINKDIVVLGDSNMLRFIIRNLITNAIKFTNAGNIRVGVSENNQGWKITVIDTGIGISEERAKKLFDWDRRHTSLGTNNEKGSGLGLLMCKEFAEKHFGNLTYESKEGEGTAFTVSINTKLAE